MKSLIITHKLLIFDIDISYSVRVGVRQWGGIDFLKISNKSNYQSGFLELQVDIYSGN